MIRPHWVKFRAKERGCGVIVMNESPHPRSIMAMGGLGPIVQLAYSIHDVSSVSGEFYPKYDHLHVTVTNLFNLDCDAGLETFLSMIHRIRNLGGSQTATTHHR